MSVLGATAPRLEDLLAGHLTVAPRIELVHAALALDGRELLATLERAASGRLDPFILVVEGSFFTEPAAGSGYFSGLGDRPEGPIPVTEWLLRLAPAAAAVIAIGTCATWGGVPAAAGNATGAVSVNDLLPGFVGATGLPVINVPGCAPSGDAFVEVLSYVLLHLEGIVPLDLDEQGRPRWLYADSTPLQAARGPEGDAVTVSTEVADCPVPGRGWIGRLGGCASVGGACVGCTRPDFPDATLPLATAPV
jgi:hydrogenase small subunit